MGGRDVGVVSMVLTLGWGEVVGLWYMMAALGRNM